MRVLNLLTGGGIGGIESLCRDIGLYSEFENGFCFLFFGGVIYRQMKRLGLKTYDLSACGGKLSCKKYRKLEAVAKGYDIVAVHHDDPFLKFYHWLLSMRLKKKYVTFVHSCYEQESFYPDVNPGFHPGQKAKRFLAKRMFQMGLDGSDKVIFVSEAGRRSYLPQFRIDGRKTEVVYNGIGMDKLCQGIGSSLPAGPPYNITYIGRLEKEKGIGLLLEAVAMLKDRYPVRVSIVGDGSCREEFERMAEELHLGDRAVFYGQRQDVVPFLKQAHIFAYPSVCQEIFGISVAEAMAFGIPCVANAVGGIPEVISDQISGYLNYSLTPPGLALALQNVLDDFGSKKMEEISRQAKKRAADFSIQNNVRKLQEVYQEII